MSLSYRDLCRLRDSGYSLSTIIVHAFVHEEGMLPAPDIARRCGLSERAVYLALRAIKDRQHLPRA